MTQPLETFVKTDDIMTQEEALDFLYDGDEDYLPLPITMSVCAGEWRREGEPFVWRFWRDPTW